MQPRRKKEKRKENRELKKSTGGDGGLTNSEQDKHLEREKKIPVAGTMEFQS
jgi:hypothetical protein